MENLLDYQHWMSHLGMKGSLSQKQNYAVILKLTVNQVSVADCDDRLCEEPRLVGLRRCLLKAVTVLILCKMVFLLVSKRASKPVSNLSTFSSTLETLWSKWSCIFFKLLFKISDIRANVSESDDSLDAALTLLEI